MIAYDLVLPERAGGRPLIAARQVQFGRALEALFAGVNFGRAREQLFALLFMPLGKQRCQERMKRESAIRRPAQERRFFGKLRQGFDRGVVGKRRA